MAAPHHGEATLMDRISAFSKEFFSLIAALGASFAASAQDRVPPPGDTVNFMTAFYEIRVVTLADDLDSPWSFAFLPNGDILLTERPGRVRLIHEGVLQSQPIAGVPEVQYKLHGGLLDITLHPGFADNRVVYLTYSKPGGEQGSATAVFRARFDGKALVDGRDIFVAEPWAKLDVNFGSRTIFGADGKLYVSFGERGPQGEPFAQDLSSDFGKIVRLNDDGTIPSDNPFVRKPGVRPEIYSYGHRNPQGMTIHPATGELWASEHGPMGGDEVNIIKAGANYGWPIVSYGRKYDGSVINGNQPWHEGMEPPRYFWVPSIGISGLLFYTGDRFPRWRDELFVTGMSGLMIQRVRQGGRGTHERESLLTPLRLEFRDLVQGPDGLLYALARQDADRTAKSGVLLRIEPIGPNPNAEAE